MNGCVCQGMYRDCPLCRGTGRVTCSCGGTGYLAVERLRNEWKHVTCPVCGDHIPMAPALPPGVPRGALAWTFERMVKLYPALVQAAVVLKGMLDSEKGWFVARSAPGRGKSYLLAATVNEALLRGQSARYYEETSKLLQDLQDAQTGRSDYTYNALMQLVTGVDVLALDEFGEQKDSEFRLVAVRELLVSRSDTGGWPVTLFATNREASEIEDRYPWLVSRFQSPEVVECDLSGIPDLRERR